LKNYLSMGFGVNSVALYLLMQDLGIEFEAIFINHGSDWPETYEYADYFIDSGRPVTVVIPEYMGASTLLEYCQKKRMTPNRMRRWCTDQFKVRPLLKHMQKPCFSHIGIDAGESHRAKISSNSGIEQRYLLIEHGIDRQGCVDLIKNHGLKIPMKSGCFFCPFQRIGQWRALRRKHPDLFCTAQSLEKNENEARAERGKNPHYVVGKNMPLENLINDKQTIIEGFGNEYPPFQCGL
jgi:hypothetical protein